MQYSNTPLPRLIFSNPYSQYCCINSRFVNMNRGGNKQSDVYWCELRLCTPQIGAITVP